jgi:hypothetical protein
MVGKVTVARIGSSQPSEKTHDRAGYCWEAVSACRFGERRPRRTWALTASKGPILRVAACRS